MQAASSLGCWVWFARQNLCVMQSVQTELPPPKVHTADREEGHKVGDTSPERESEVLMDFEPELALSHLRPILWLQSLSHTVFVSSLKVSPVIQKCMLYNVNSPMQLLSSPF